MPTDPRITVIIPHFNHGRFLERALCSVLDQGYDNLELAVMDGGSCDGSTELIRRYEDELDWWVSLNDAGPADAVNRALNYATGDVLGWLSADDLYAPFALHIVAERMSQPDRPQWIVGGCERIDRHDRTIGQPEQRPPQSMSDLLCSTPDTLPAEASFFRAELLRRYGPLETMLHHHFTHEMHCRLLARGVRPTLLSQVLAYRRLHTESMTGRDPWLAHRERSEIAHLYTRTAPAASHSPLPGDRHAA